jgi:acrylyl-CoA reductase (NADPH)
MDLPTNVAPFILRGVKLVGINSVSTPMPRRLKVWERLVQDLDLSKLHALTTHVSLEGVPEVAADIVAGKVKGRVVVDIRQG